MSHKWNSPLSRSDHLPLWCQIAERLRGAIKRGEFSPGEVLPSEAQLNAVFGVSRATSRASLNELEREGLIVRRSGKGSIVLRSRVDQPAEEMSGFAEDMRRRGLAPSYETLEAGMKRASAEVAEALEIKPGTMVFHSRRVLKADDVPIGLALSWLAPRLFRHVKPPTADELQTGSMYRWLNMNCGVSITKAKEYIEADIASGQMSDALGISTRAALLIARRQSFDADGKPVEYAALHFRADRYRFHLEVSQGTIQHHDRTA